MIIAVTGANGFIGRHLCAALVHAGHDPRPVVRADFEANRLPERFAGADVVIHAAAATRAPSRGALWRANVHLTEHVITACRVAGVARLVFVSSQAAAGPAPSRDMPVREDDRPAPVEPYGETKLEAERLVAGSGIPYAIVRPAAVYGPDDRDFALLFALARRRLAIHPANRDHWISIVHVDDCVCGIVLAATVSAAERRTYFIANDAPVQWGTLFELASVAAGGPPRLDVEVPAFAVRAGGWLGDVYGRVSRRAPLLSSSKITLGAQPYWVCSNERAKAELGFLPNIALDRGIAMVVTG